MSLLVGLEKRIREQKTLPDWFIEDPEQFCNHYCGTYLGTWCIICKYSRTVSNVFQNGNHQE